MEQYIKRHENRGEYINTHMLGGCRCHTSRYGWEDIEIGDSMIFSHRTTGYTRETFTEGFHSHDYSELLVYVGGDVEYIGENTLMSPVSGCAVSFSPGIMHTARLLSASVYERYVLYFFPDFFEYMGRTVPIPGFDGSAACASRLIPADSRLAAILHDAEAAVCSDAPYGGLLARSLIISFFGVLAASSQRPAPATGTLTGELAEVKRYIDENYAQIRSVSDVSERFFYSREHLSRTFRSHFNVSLSEYIVKRRISESLGLLEHMSVADACYAVGFGNQTSFISAFRRIVGCLPSEYKKSRECRTDVLRPGG